MVASAAAQATALAPYVPPWEPGQALAMRASGAAMAESGNPEAMPLAVMRMSASTPKWSPPQNFPVRPHPVCTSSTTSRMPCRSARSRSPAKNRSLPGT